MATPIDKRLTSYSYRRKIKRLISQVKILRDIHHIGDAPPRPIWSKTRVATKEEKAALDVKQEAYDAKWAKTPTRDSCHYLLDPMTDDLPRRGRNR